MSEFNRMTIVAAAEVISLEQSHSDMELLEVQWGIAGRCDRSSKAARAADWARIACEEKIKVLTKKGKVHLSRALIECAIAFAEYAEYRKHFDVWKKLFAGLRFDGFEVRMTQVGTETTAELVRMLPSDVPELIFREAESEVTSLLDRHVFTVAKRHLEQAVSAFSRGEWSSANGELRNFYESYLKEIATNLGYAGSGGNSKTIQKYLGNLEPPFLLAEYNEQRYVQGLMIRMHPHGPHPGLSEEEDATFRLQISLVTARLFLRRFDQRPRD